MRTVYACSLRFPGRDSAESIWLEVSAWIVGWYSRNAPEVTLPAGWAEGGAGSFAPCPGHTLDATNFAVDDTGPLRQIRWRYPDSSDRSLLWDAEAVVFAGDDDTFFTLLLKIVSVNFELLPARYQLGTPRLVRTLVGRGDAWLGDQKMALAPERVEADSVQPLVDILLSKSRRHPVVVLSPSSYGEMLSVDSTTISNALAGVASVHVLASKWAAFALTDEVGKRYSCYNGAVRIYWPRFSLEGDPRSHRLWLPSEISEFGGSENFARVLLRKMAAAASFRFVEPESVRAFRIHCEDIRIAALKAMKSGDYDALFEDYIRVENETQELRLRLEAVMGENETLRENFAALQSVSEHAATKPKPATDDIPDPKTVHDAVTEAQRRTSRLVYLEDAFSSARESPFKQPNKAYSALLAIDDVATLWAEQLDGGPNPGPRKEAFRTRGFEYKENISQTSESKWGDEYTYLYDGKKVLFSQHITIGAKQAEKCLSIHMYWDEIRRCVVIAHVGRHKTNTRS